MAPTTVELGSTGLKVSSIGYGAMGLTAFYNQKDSNLKCTGTTDEQGLEVLRACVASGVNFVDTAQVCAWSTLATCTRSRLERARVCFAHLVCEYTSVCCACSLEISSKWNMRTSAAAGCVSALREALTGSSFTRRHPAQPGYGHRRVQ